VRAREEKKTASLRLKNNGSEGRDRAPPGWRSARGAPPPFVSPRIAENAACASPVSASAASPSNICGFRSRSPEGNRGTARTGGESAPASGCSRARPPIDSSPRIRAPGRPPSRLFGGESP